MQITFDNFRSVKYFFGGVAALIVVLSVVFTNRLASDMASEERQRIDLWAEATRRLVSEADDADLSFILKVIEGNNSIPVLIADEDGVVLTHRNIDLTGRDEEQYLARCLTNFKEANEPILIALDESTFHYLYYDDSLLLKRLAYYPYIQAGIIIIFFVVLFFVFASAKKSEQDRVWVGLSKETAHQLGTPISSLLAWMEILKSGDVDASLLPEMEKDVARLQTIAERFSKIGSKPERKEVVLNELLENTLAYMRKRTSNKVSITSSYSSVEPVRLWLNPPLFEWVIENLCKNAIDAMDGVGSICVEVESTDSRVLIDVSDTGKGIPKSKFKTVFNPGYTTKKRGWGLGLSLVKRIVEEYHQGKIFVKSSELNKGTTFRIALGLAACR